jgi:hypothetical protein
MLRSENNPKVLAAITEIVKGNRTTDKPQETKVSEALASRYSTFKPTAEQKPVALQEELSPKQKMHIDKNKNGKIDAHDFKLLKGQKAASVKEKTIDEAGNPAQNAAIAISLIKAGKKEGKMPKPMKEENKDTPGNSYKHQCAIHVKSEQFGEGRTLTSQHAEPDEYGNIAWYDVMFEHGIEKYVASDDLEILVSESHGNHKKKA